MKMNIKTTLFATLLSVAATTPAFANNSVGDGISFNKSDSVNPGIELDQLILNNEPTDQHRDRSYGKADLQKFLSTQIDNARLKQRLYHQKRIQQNARLLREERPHHQARLRNEARSNNEALRYNAAPVLRDVRKLDSDS